MSTTTQTESQRELQEALDRVVKGVRDPEAARKALERMKRMAEEMRQRVGVVDVAVDLIREARDS